MRSFLYEGYLKQINSSLGKTLGTTLVFNNYPGLSYRNYPKTIQLILFKGLDYYKPAGKSKLSNGQIIINYEKSPLSTVEDSPENLEFRFTVETKSNPEFSQVYDHLKDIASRWSQDNYLQSDFFKNMQIKFGDKVTQYFDKIMLSRKIPSASNFDNALKKMIPSHKVELLNKVMEFYASIKRLND